MFRLPAVLLGALVVLSGFMSDAAAQTAAEFYKGKVVKLVVGYGAGGGYDTYARLLAPHLEAQLDATVVVENRPGGGGNLALNRLMTAKPDGLTLMLINGRASTMSQLVGTEGVRFDLTRLTVLGRVTSEPRVILFSAASPYRSLADAQTAADVIKWGAAGRTDSLASVAAMASTALDLNSEIIMGYKGSKEAGLAVIRGEVDALVLSESSAAKYAKGGMAIPIAVFGRERSEILPDLPTVFEVASLGDDAAWWVDYTEQLTKIGRIFVSTPDVPDDRTRFLRQAVQAVLEDPQIVSDMASQKRPIRAETAEVVEQYISGSLAALDEATLARVRSVVLEEYYPD